MIPNIGGKKKLKIRHELRPNQSICWSFSSSSTSSTLARIIRTNNFLPHLFGIIPSSSVSTLYIHYQNDRPSSVSPCLCDHVFKADLLQAIFIRTNNLLPQLFGIIPCSYNHYQNRTLGPFLWASCLCGRVFIVELFFYYRQLLFVPTISFHNCFPWTTVIRSKNHSLHRSSTVSFNSKYSFSMFGVSFH